ncbi:hypothetical protein [Pectobacterium brasiliense]|uniref:hypothetical protein n=1 Tax=Pectobacterium brasiliense TaxID=180957 RepID=UPI0013DFF8C6|nr:hypothetical protein [Pectobacterium brasiliense]MBN7767333.1 hypothetical protein [Pectobacterium brasiliense]
MTDINYEDILLKTGLADATSSANQFQQNTGAMSYDFRGLPKGLNCDQQFEPSKLKCSTRTVSYSSLHVSTATKA